MLRRIPLLADTPPKPWARVPEDFTADGRRRVFHGGTMGFARGAPFVKCHIFADDLALESTHGKQNPLASSNKTA